MMGGKDFLGSTPERNLVLFPFGSPSEGQFTYWKSVRDFFKTIGYMRIFDGFFLEAKEFLPKVYEIFWE